jgi:hypothetical protein
MGVQTHVDTLEYIVFSGHVAAPEPSTWWGQVLFTTRLEIAAWASRLHAVVRGTPVSGYQHNAIIGRGTLNAFEPILHATYLCMKIPSDQSPIAVHESQESARRGKGNWTNSKAIHNIDKVEAHQQHKYIRDKAASADKPKSILLCEDIAEHNVLFGSQLSEEQEKALSKFLFNNRDVFARSAKDLCGVNRDSSSILSMLIQPSDQGSRSFRRCHMTKQKVQEMK